jgi:hydroxyacylglutathione hydrolase
LEEIAQGVYRVPARRANTYLVEAPNGLVLVDTGMPGSEKRILNAVSKIGRKPNDIKLILLTHRHLDHIGSSAYLKKESMATLVSHQFEKPYVAGTLVIITPRAWSLYGRIVRRSRSVGSSIIKFFRLVKYQPTHVDEVSDEESVLDHVGLDGSVVWTPGHTKGSVSRGKLVEPMFMENPNQTKSSVQRIVDLHPVVLCPGHGKPLPPSKIRLKERVVQPIAEPKKPAEDIDLEGLTRDLSTEA